MTVCDTGVYRCQWNVESGNGAEEIFVSQKLVFEVYCVQNLKDLNDKA